MRQQTDLGSFGRGTAGRLIGYAGPSGVGHHAKPATSLRVIFEIVVVSSHPRPIFRDSHPRLHRDVAALPCFWRWLEFSAVN